MIPHPTQTQRTSRGGFTLVELLVVIAIISILVGLSFRVLSASMENARTEATRTTIRHLDSALQDRLEDFERVNFRPLATRFKAIFDIENSTNLPTELALLMMKKDRFRAAFPQRLADLYGFDGKPGGGDDSPLLAKMSRPRIATDPNSSWLIQNTKSVDALAEAAESSELLYLALTEGAVFGSPPPALDRIPQRHIGDTDRDGNLEFLDDWGRPLRFYNWTTRLIRPGTGADISQTVFARTVGVLMPDVIRPTSSDPTVPSGPLLLNDYSHPLNQDPDDVTGALGAALLSAPPQNYFAVPFTYNGNTDEGKPFTEAYYHTADTYYVPLIVSGGPDEKVGLWEPDASDPRNPTAAAPTEAQFFRRLGLPLGIDPASPTTPDTALLDLLYDNITNRQP